jgi:MFS family permease
VKRLEEETEASVKSGLPETKKSRRTGSLITYLLMLFICGLEGRVMAAWKGASHEEDVVNLTFSIYLIATLVLGIPSNYLISKLGIRRSCMIASLVLTAGAVVRCFFTRHSMFVYLGQFIVGMAAPLTQNGIYVYSKQTFSKQKVASAEQLSLVVALMVGCELFGLAMGSILPSFLLPEEEQTAMPVERLRALLMIEAGVVLLLVPCVFMVFRLGTELAEKQLLEQQRGL